MGGARGRSLLERRVVALSRCPVVVQYPFPVLLFENASRYFSGSLFPRCSRGHVVPRDEKRIARGGGGQNDGDGDGDEEHGVGVGREHGPRTGDCSTPCRRRRRSRQGGGDRRVRLGVRCGAHRELPGLPRAGVVSVPEGGATRETEGAAAEYRAGCDRGGRGPGSARDARLSGRDRRRLDRRRGGRARRGDVQRGGERRLGRYLRRAVRSHLPR